MTSQRVHSNVLCVRSSAIAVLAMAGAAWAKVTSIVSPLRWRSCSSVPSSTSRPWRKMPMRSQSASTSLRMCEERKTAWPRAFALQSPLRARR